MVSGALQGILVGLAACSVVLMFMGFFAIFFLFMKKYIFVYYYSPTSLHKNRIKSNKIE
jgi:hypothetical protein